MKLPLLDLYVLSLIERGLDTAYSFQREVGLSLGASTPALRRLDAARLVKCTEEEGATGRPRYVYSLTPSGRERATNGWREHFQYSRIPSDIDGLLRLADMATHYGNNAEDVAKLLKSASLRRSGLGWQAAAAPEESSIGIYPRMRARCEGARLLAEAKILAELAVEVSGANAQVRHLGSRQSSPTTRHARNRTRRSDHK
jgi:DNA-binding PadR family transcriptional regulator